MMSIYPIVRIKLSFIQFSLLCYEFCILSKTEYKSIYYHFRRDHESSSFRKIARNKWICRETCDFYFVINLLLAINSIYFWCFQGTVDRIYLGTFLWHFTPCAFSQYIWWFDLFFLAVLRKILDCNCSYRKLL